MGRPRMSIEQKKCTVIVALPPSDIKRIDHLVSIGRFDSRSAAIRQFVREGLQMRATL